MNCPHCGKPLAYEYGSRGEGSYVKHGCLGEVVEYFSKMDEDTRRRTLACAALCYRAGFNPSFKFSLLGYCQPVDWHQCHDWFVEQWTIGHYAWK